MRHTLSGFFATALALTSVQAAAQQHADAPAATRTATPPAGSKRWRVDAPAVTLTSERDNNVFLLANSKRDNVEAPSGEDVLSRRYVGMTSPSDLITTIDAEAGLKGPGLAGRTLAIRPGVRYEYYAQNTDRRNATFRLDVEQGLGHGNEFRLRARMTPSYMAKNYLADAVDIDASGTIALGERIYRPGTYSEMEYGADYRHRLNESTKRSPFGSALRIGAGYYSRTFERPFASRDLSGPTGKVSFLADVSRRVKFDVGYEVAVLSATPADEVLLLDEQSVDMDLNGNGNSSDVDVRSTQRVDRSRTEHVVGLGGRVELTRRVDLGAELEHRRRSYGSGEPLDVAYNGRSDARNRLGVELSMKLSPRVRFAVTNTITSQRLSRETDFGSTGEIADYSRHSVGFRVGYRF